MTYDSNARRQDNGTPQICLIVPSGPDPRLWGDMLPRILDRVPIACVRLSVAGWGPACIARTSEAVRQTAHARDVAVVIDGPGALAGRFGLDGVHLGADVGSVGKARRALGGDAIVGAFCAASRHDGMVAGEAGADYVAFGPTRAVDPGGAGGGAGHAAHDLFAWWAEMIEIPVMAEGGLNQPVIEALAPVTDFFAIGPEIWGGEDPLTALVGLLAPLAPLR